MNYEYRGGSVVKGVAAKDAFKELERIRVKCGLTPKNIVAESRAKNAVLHPAFEWNDKKAAEEYRLWEARQIARSVVVIKDDNVREPVYVHVQALDSGEEKQPREGRYEPMDLVVDSPDLFEQALGELRSKLRSAAEAVHALERAAKQSKDPDKMMRVSLAVKALDAAQSAIAALH